jgi:DNA-binding GntR family transcriptional regulator
MLLFDMVTLTGVPAEKLLQLKVEQLVGYSPESSIPLAYKGKITKHRIVMTQLLYESFNNFLEEVKPDHKDYIFKSRKGSGPLTLSSLSRMVKFWMKANGIETAGSIRSLRRAWRLYTTTAGRASIEHGQIKKNADYLRPVEIPTRQEVVYKELEAAILSGHIRPGERIVSEEVAKKLGVSQIPVREALRRLEAAGLISTRPNRRSTVSELSKDNLEEILQIRIHLESLAARKAAKKGDQKILKQLIQLHKKYTTARVGNIVDDLLQSNKEFHHTLYKAADMPILLNMIEQLWDRVSPYYYILFRQSVKPNPVIGIKYHQEIICAVEQQNLEAVSKWITADLTDSTHFVLSLFETTDPSLSPP